MAFQITSPSIIHCGAGELVRVPDEAARLGKRAMIVTGAHLRGSELLENLHASLGEAGLMGLLAAPIADEPGVEDADRLASLAKENSIDIVIAIGGGSVMDAAKAAAALATNEGTAEDYQLKRREIRNPPITQIFVPTTAGTGSEATRVSVLSNASLGVKRSFSHPSMTPDVVVLDPILTVTLPLYLTTVTAMDALAHAIESAVSPKANPYTRAIALSGIRQLATGLRGCQIDAGDLDARLNCLVGSCFAGLAMQEGLGATHSLAPAICMVGSIRHSEAVGAMLPHVIRMNERLCPRAYDEVKQAMGCDDLAQRIEELCAAGGFANDLTRFGMDASDWEEVFEVMGRYSNHRATNPVNVTDEYACQLFSISLCE